MFCVACSCVCVSSFLPRPLCLFPGAAAFCPLPISCRSTTRHSALFGVSLRSQHIVNRCYTEISKYPPLYLPNWAKWAQKRYCIPGLSIHIQKTNPGGTDQTNEMRGQRAGSTKSLFRGVTWSMSSRSHMCVIFLDAVAAT